MRNALRYLTSRLEERQKRIDQMAARIQKLCRKFKYTKYINDVFCKQIISPKLEAGLATRSSTKASTSRHNSYQLQYNSIRSIFYLRKEAHCE